MNEKSSSNMSNNSAQVFVNGVVDPISVLHVDDEEIFLQATKIFLEKTTGGKIQVDSLINPEQVFGKLEKKKYDVIVADYIMPSMNGLQLLERLRNQNNDVPYIILTGRGREEMVIKALNLGANRYIKKGMDTESQFSELIHAIEEVVHYKRTYEALQESEKKYRSRIDNLSEIVVEADKEGVFRYVSPQVFDILGYKSEELIGKSCFDQIHPDDIKRAKEIVEKALTGKSIFDFEHRKKHKDGHYIWVSCSGRGDKENRLVFVMKDITESKQLQKKIQQERQQFERAINSLDHPFYAINANDYTIQLVNTAAKKNYGEFAQPMTCYKLTHNESKPCSGKEHKCPLVEVIKTKKPCTTEHHHFDDDGRVRSYEIVCHPIFDQKGNVIQVIEYSIDITEKKQAEEVMKTRLKLEQLEARLSRDFINIPLEGMDQMITKTLKEIAEFAGAVRSSLFLYSEDLQTVTNTHEWCENPENSQIALLQNIPSDTFGYYWELLQQKKNVVMSFKTDLPPEAEIEWEWIREHGWQSALFVPMVFEGKLYGVLGFYGEIGEERQWFDDLVPLLLFVATILTNTFERKQAEEALRESEERLRAFIYSSTHAIDFWDSDLNLIDCNQAVLDYFSAGTTKEDLIGKNITEIIPDIKETGRYDKYIEVLKTGKPYNLESFVSHPKFGDKIFSAQAVKVGDGLGMITSDITDRKQAEEALGESEKKYRTILESIEDSYYEVDLAGNFTFFNDSLCKFLGYSKDELMGMNYRQYMDGENAKQVYQTFNTVYKTGQPTKASGWEIIRKDGTMRFNEASVSLIIGSSGEPVGFRGIVRDITERKEMEEALRESKEKYQMLVEKLEEGVLLEDADGIITFVNPRAMKRLGYSEEEIIGKHWSFTSPPEDVEKYQDETSKRPKGISSTYESGILSKKGERIPVIVSATPLHSPDGEYLGTLSVFRDISERKKAELQLQESEERFRLLGEKIAIGLSIVQEGKLVYGNDSFFEITGAPKEETLGIEIYEFNKKQVHPEDLAFVQEQLQKKISDEKNGLVPRYQYRWYSKNNQLKWIEVISKSITFQGKSALLGAIIDITRQKQAEKALRESEEKYRIIFELAPIAIGTSSLEGKPLTFNLKAMEMLGYAAVEYDELRTNNLEETYVNPDDRTKINKELTEFGKLKDWEVRRKRKDGSDFWALMNAQIIEQGGQNIIHATMQDTTERKKMEEEIKYRLEIEQLLSDISTEFINISGDQIDDTIYSTLKRISQFIGVNRSSLFLLSKDQTIITNTHEWCDSPEDSQIKQLQGIPFETFGYYAKILSNHEIVNIARLNDLPPDAHGEREWIQQYGFRSLLFIPLLQKGKLHGTLGFYGEVEKEIIWPEIFVDLLKFLGNLFINGLERKQAEEALKKSVHQLESVNKELKDFSSIVAHDLKAPVRNMKTIVDWLLRDFADDLNEEGKEYLSTIVKLTTHMNMLIDGVYHYSKIDRFHKEIVKINLNNLLSEIIHVLSPPDNIKIDIQAELPVIAADRTHITQIFSNLIENAIKFMDKPKGHININCEEEKNLYQFSVADTGPGIEESHFERIFQMFQTLSSRDETKGTGIGLAIVKKVVELNGGGIWLESTVGEGSTFYFTLPKG